MHLWSINLCKRRQDYPMGGGAGQETATAINGVGKTGQLHVKRRKIITLFHTIHKNKFQMD